MNIDRNNYEMYFLDYLEGRLTTDETAALLLFADENPDLAALLEGEEMISLVADEAINFLPKSALKKKPVNGEASLQKINAGNYEEFMIRFYDNDLNDSEQSKLANFMKDSPTFMKEFELFGITLLKPDTEIVYAHKNRLKRNFIVRPYFKGVVAMVSVAASILLFSTLFLKYFDQPIPKESNSRLADQFTKKIESVKTAKQPPKSAEIVSPDVNRPNKNHYTAKTLFRKTLSIIRTGFDVPSSLIMKQPVQFATTPISVPKSITPRLDFYGISAMAYYDPQPDTVPLNSGRGTFGGRIGQTLVQGISQTAGTLAREPELSRLLHGKISLSDIAGLGLAGFNLVTDSKLTISRKYDEDGYVKGYTIVDGKKSAE